MSNRQDHSPSQDDAADEAWLAGLQGQPASAVDPAIRQEAQALRQGLQARREKLDTSIPQADDLLFEQIRFQVRRDQANVRGRPWNKPSVWGLAASLVLGLAVVFQLAGPGFDGDLWGRAAGGDTMRGTPSSATVLLVDDLGARRDALVALLRRAGVEPLVQGELASGQVIIQAQATQAVRDALGGDEARIYPDILDGQITLVLKQAKPGPTKPKADRP